jgi:hypothetical protein
MVFTELGEKQGRVRTAPRWILSRIGCDGEHAEGINDRHAMLLVRGFIIWKLPCF